MSRDTYGESGDSIVAPVMKKICKHVDTIAIPSITTTLKTGLLFWNFLLLLYNFHGVTLSYNSTQVVYFGICEENYVQHLDEHIQAHHLWNPIGGGVHRNLYKWGIGGKIQVIGASHFLWYLQLRCLVFLIIAFLNIQPHYLSPCF